MKHWLLTICAMMGMALLTSQLAQAGENDLRRNTENMFREDHEISLQIEQKMGRIRIDEADRDALRNLSEKSPKDLNQIAEFEVAIRKGWEEVYLLNMKKIQSSQRFGKAAEAMVKARNLPDAPVFADNHMDSQKSEGGSLSAAPRTDRGLAGRRSD